MIRQTLVWPNRLSYQFPMEEVSMPGPHQNLVHPQHVMKVQPTHDLISQVVDQNRVPAVQGVLQVD